MTARLNVIGVIVADLAPALAFYRRLGLEFGEDLGGHVEATLPGGFRLTLDTEENIRSFAPNAAANLRGETGRIGLAFQCDSPAEVDALFDELTAAGYHGELKPFDAFWGQRYATVHDPDGNGVDLYAPLT
ncbi:VOC family protein [Nocardia blacklockiae]|uniref:VOC family protein n=1 Tax=Nocardia blacklockiae TaxID=480036 RepID=UPI001893D1A5|nr:VOC family protein [Nocardia blacklockiae]MBF6174851.1 VOC family protein [Nocardia blacklockiae]